MRGLVRVFLWSAVAMAGVIAAGYASLPFIQHTIFACEETDYRTVPSPDGSRAAVVHQRDCGATTPFNSQVSVVKRLPTAETSREPLFVVHGEYDLLVRWIDDATLAIGVPPGEQVYRKDTTFDGGRVIYEHGGVVPRRTPANP